ncbi:MAG: TlpA family protein disulfide reductase [Rhodospirillaceae bacterium]|nr:TlpA family protein disulfide reductase [Rhodospirillaceae bacterium]
MPKDVDRRLQSLRATALLSAALLITAAVGVASRTPLFPVGPAFAAAEAGQAKSGAIVWHEAPKPLPETVFKDAADADQTLAKFPGKVLVVNFWATWCAPCVKEMPTLNALQAKLGGPEFQVLAISQDREGAKVAQPFFAKNDWKNLNFYVEKMGRFSKDANLRGLPTTLIIDKTGKEVARVEGEAKWDSPEVEKTLRELIAKK